jgi:hypothetical protein
VVTKFSAQQKAMLRWLADCDDQPAADPGEHWFALPPVETWEVPLGSGRPPADRRVGIGLALRSLERRGLVLRGDQGSSSVDWKIERWFAEHRPVIGELLRPRRSQRRYETTSVLLTDAGRAVARQLRQDRRNEEIGRNKVTG